MLNKVTLIGNLGKDQEIRTTESGVPRANFTLATNENYKYRNGNWQKSTEWHDLVMWRGLAERAKVLRKGMLVYVEGKLTHRKLQDRDGKDHYSAEVTVDLLRILEKREHSGTHGTSTTGNVNNDPKKEETHGNEDFNPNVSEDDLPF